VREQGLVVPPSSEDAAWADLLVQVWKANLEVAHLRHAARSLDAKQVKYI
jgi:hypothetical protein